MADVKHQLIVNYVPGEECRIAVIKGGKLEEFHSERSAAISHVGNIYVGKVVNVEPAISAAFVDFGLEHNGFLHVSDLHPRYFGGDKGAKERVGKKTPRRERPPINEALRRGQEIIVQVLKEGVGTKGPTVTSYLSIPGRYLVMMPNMDKVGVSRKVEDEETRAKMKAILDQLDLPEECGFILRTAGLDRTKMELKRDLSYLQRLWKDMEKRRKAGGKPRLLYSESDLLVRALRDMMTSEVDQVIIDSEIALKRAARFVKIVSPRTATKLVHYKGHTPIFHALGVEEQIRTMYAREVPLPSGGRLVIDETEALVAIDVNSGKSRSAGDSEQNAYRTNLEAAEEIVRQLRLRDMGGIVVNDLIDMRLAKHRKDVEKTFEELLSKDRAKSTIAPISDFGILEMTRQRMRGSHESLHFSSCPTCHGRGLVQRAESVASDALRELTALLDHQHVARAEMVLNPRIGGELLSGKRKALARIERLFNKPVSIRLSDATPVDRVTMYAYDEQGADIEIDRLPKYKAKDDTLVPYTEPGVTDAPPEEEESWAADTGAEREPEPVEPEEKHLMPEPHMIETEPLPGEEPAASGPGRNQQGQGDRGEGEGEGRGGRRRRGRRGRGGRGGGGGGDMGGPQGGQHNGHGPGGHHGQPGPDRGPGPTGEGGPDGGPAGEAFNGPDGGVPAEGRGDQPQGEFGPDGGPGDQPERASDNAEFRTGPTDQFGQFGPGEGGGGRRRRRRRRGRGGRGGGGGDGMGPMQGQGQGQGQPHGQGGHSGPGQHAHGPQQGGHSGGPGGPPQGFQQGGQQQGPQGGQQGRDGGRPPMGQQQQRPFQQNQPRWGGGGGGGGGGQQRPPQQGGQGGQGQRQGFGGGRQGGSSRFEGLAGAFRAEAMRGPANPPADGSTGGPDGPPSGEPIAGGQPPRDGDAGGPQGGAPSDAPGFLDDGRGGAPQGDGPGGGEPGFDSGGPNEGFDGPGQGGQGGGGGRRRRRRGRGGRGGGGGGNGGGNGGGGGDRFDGPPPAQQGDGGRPPSAPMNRPTMPPQQSQAPAPAPKPAPAGDSSPAPAAAKRPRLLYSAFRKLKPGEKGNIKRDE